MSLFLGMLSGTSADALDAALVDFADPAQPRLLARVSQPLSTELHRRIVALYNPGDSEIDRLGEVDAALGEAFAALALQCLADAGVEPAAVRAIGCHGQTIRHRPGANPPFTLQIGDPNRIAHRTGIPVVADFRRRDMAAGGQGAPLASGFHLAVFGQVMPAGVLNIGGIANLTVLRPGGVLGFDTGPGNALMDAWIGRVSGARFDRDGALASAGKVAQPLLAELLRHPYLAKPAPKSTGREEFTDAWLTELLVRHAKLAPADIQATLAEFTAATIADAVEAELPTAAPVYVCGGGAHNGYLMDRLAARMPERKLATTAELGIEPAWVEAMTFAWLAERHLAGEPGNVPSVTGAARPVVLGALFPP